MAAVVQRGTTASGAFNDNKNHRQPFFQMSSSHDVKMKSFPRQIGLEREIIIFFLSSGSYCSILIFV